MIKYFILGVSLLGYTFGVRWVSNLPELSLKPNLTPREVSRIIETSKQYDIVLGRLHDRDNNYYCYFFESKLGFHLLYRYSPTEKRYLKVYQTEAGPGSEKAQFVDCNFDNTMDILIKIRTGGNYTAQILNIVLQKEGVFLESGQDVSFPTFDAIESTVFSRYKAPNDTFISVEKFKWKQDRLVLDTLIHIPVPEYELKYGCLN